MHMIIPYEEREKNSFMQKGARYVETSCQKRLPSRVVEKNNTFTKIYCFIFNEENAYSMICIFFHVTEQMQISIYFFYPASTV